jgi:hypothetical protein
MLFAQLSDHLLHQLHRDGFTGALGVFEDGYGGAVGALGEPVHAA